MAETGRWALPLLEAGQAQKEMTVNEALARLDLAVQAAVEARGLNTPPAAPSVGQAWIVGADPSGGWLGHTDAVAGWTTGGWRFVEPREGLRAWSAADGCMLTYANGQWRAGVFRGGVQVVGAQAGPIATPTGGVTVDVEARTALLAVLTAMRTHGLIAT